MSKLFPIVWANHITKLLATGIDIAPRGCNTKELPQQTLEIDMRLPVLTIPKRKVSYQFMAAEAYWILTGDNKVSTIAPYNRHIAAFSDDGKTFFGAYGPKVMGQLDYVVRKLIQDPTTRQAGLTIWRENPPETKDVPCTIAMFFMIRSGLLNCHTFMRSSDIWLGVPYDVFTFSMISHLVCTKINEIRISPLILPGTLHLTAASSHIYERNFEAAKACVSTSTYNQCPTPLSLYLYSTTLLSKLKSLRTSKSGDPLRWWENENN